MESRDEETSEMVDETQVADTPLEEDNATSSPLAGTNLGEAGEKESKRLDDGRTNGVEENGDTIMEEVESPFSSTSSGSSPAASSTSSSQEESAVTLVERMHELSDIESAIASFLNDAAEALRALDPTPFGEKSRKDAFAESSIQFLDKLEVSLPHSSHWISGLMTGCISSIEKKHSSFGGGRCSCSTNPWSICHA